MLPDHEACRQAALTRDTSFDGRFFTAVRATGVYCRPICCARPAEPETMIFMPSAAAAEAAGFRPCPRCRPELSPNLAPWNGTAAAVSRAIALIATGVLTSEGVAGLSARLGIDEGQLQHLFRTHLGASPEALARTRQMLFAKQLVTDTRLPLTEVALAAGFGSLRRFSEAFRARYGQLPRSLDRTEASDPATKAVTLTLPYKPPYDWAGVIRFLSARAIRGVEVVRPDVYARSIALAGMHGTLTVRPAEQGDALIATIHFPVVAALPEIVERLRRLFDLSADPAVICAHLSEDPHLAQLVATHPGMRVPGAWDGFELAVRGILGQQITVAAATTLAGKLAVLCGTPLPPADDPALAGLTHVFPTPERLACERDLGLTIGMPRNRASAIIALAEAAAADPGLFDPGPELEDAVARLRALRGIGEWTAQYIAMRALREPDAFPAADIGLLRAMETAEGRPTPAQLIARAAPWRPWRAYAVLHLWASGAARSADTGKEALR